MKKIFITPFIFLGLFRSLYSQQELKWHNITSLYARAITADPYRDNLLWIAGSGGLRQYNKLFNSWKSFTTAEGLSKIWCRSLFVDKDVIWVGTESGGANLFDLASERFTPFMQFPENPYYPEYRPTVNAIYPDANIVWLGTEGGLFQVDRSSLDTLRRFTMADGLGENYIYSIVDDGQYLWLATAYGGAFIPESPPLTGGLTRLDKITHNIQNFRIAEGPYVNWFWSLTKTGDVLWVAGDRGLMTFDKQTQLFSVVAEDVIKGSHAVVADQEDIWCIGYSTDSQEHLFRVDRHTLRVKNSIVLPYDYLNAGLSVDASTVYVVKRNHFYRIPKFSHQLEEIPTPFLPGPYCYAVTADNQNAYASSANHLVVIDQSDFSISKIKLLEGEEYIIRGITIDENQLWIGTNQGLLQYNCQTLTLINSYLPSLIVYFTIVDDNYVWASTRLGLYKIEKQTGEMAYKDLTPDLHTSGAPQITSLVLDGDFIWLSFSGQEIGGGLISGLVKLDRNTLMTLQLKKISIGDYTQAIATLIDCDTYLLASGGVISKVSKDSLTLETHIHHKASKMSLRDSFLWVIVPHGGIKVFDMATQEARLHLNESTGLLHDYVTDLFLSDKYAWFTTYAGVSVVELSSITKAPNGKAVPKSLSLFQNYPNPFNTSTVIRYEVPQTSFVILEIYNLLGQKVRTLVNEWKPAGSYPVYWDGKDDQGIEVSSGLYLYQIRAGNFNANRKLLLIR